MPNPAPPASTGSRPDAPFSWRFTTPLFLGSALNPMNSSMIATALVPIATALHVPVGRTAVLVSALYLASTVAQPTAGKVADVLGPRRVFVAGLLLVFAGGLLGGVATGMTPLLVGRVLIGLGTSCANPTAMLLIRGRARATGLTEPPGAVLGGLQVAGVATASLGLPIGGVLVALFGWRAVFLVNLPVALVALVAVLRWIPRDTPTRTRHGVSSLASALDVPGVAGFVAAMVALLLFLSALPVVKGWLLAVSVVLWVVLVLWERRVRSPFLDVRALASDRALTRTHLRFALVMLCSYLVLYGVTQWLQQIRGLSPAAAGLLLLPMTLASGVVTVPLARRNLVRVPLVLAAVACGVAAAGVLLLPGPAWLAGTLAVTALLGLAQGAAGTGNTVALYTQAAEAGLGTAAGLLRSFGYLGSIASSAVIGIVFRDGATDIGITAIGLTMLATSAVLLALTALDRRLPRVAHG